MTKLVCSATMSLDGFIAGPGGDMSWMAPYLDGEPDPAVEAFMEEVGALLVGRRTHGGDDPYKGVEGKEGEAFGGGWSGPQVVLTHRPPAVAEPGVTFATDLDAAIAAARSAAAGKDVNVLGADVARQCLEAGALDELLIAIAPVLLGDGVRLFDRPGGAPVRLEPIAATTAPHATSLRLRVVR